MLVPALAVWLSVASQSGDEGSATTTIPVYVPALPGSAAPRLPATPDAGVSSPAPAPRRPAAPASASPVVPAPSRPTRPAPVSAPPAPSAPGPVAGDAVTPPPGTPTTTAAAPVPLPPAANRFRGALEALVHSLPSGTAGGSQDVFGRVTPLLGFVSGDDFAIELGADLRLRVFDDPPAQREADFGGVLRREDWDERSDFGQLVRELRIGSDAAKLAIDAGPLLRHTLGHGHLVARYSNRVNPDYHPAGADLRVYLGPTRTELFASDVLGSRIFAGEVSVDLGRVLAEDAEQFDRYHAALSFAHDGGAAGGVTPRLTLLHLDVDTALHRDSSARVFAYGGFGSRIYLEPPPLTSTAASLGALLGLSAEGTPGGVQLGGRLELRKQGGGFRHGMFGPDYELARFAGTGFSGEPLAHEQLPDSFSGFGELSFATGVEASEQARYVLAVAAEHFAWGRTDVDVALALRTAGAAAMGTVRFVASGLGQRERYGVLAEARYRFRPALYAIASGGSVFFPQPDSTLVRGVYAGLGLGADFER